MRPGRRCGILDDPRSSRWSNSREVFPPHRQDTREKALAIQSCCASFCLTSPRTICILRSLPNCARPLSSPRCHQRLTCFASRQSRAFQHLSLPAHSLVMHVAAPHHSLTRSRKPSLDRLQRPWVSLVEHDGDKLARSLRLLVTSSHWLWRSDTASPCFLCMGKRDVMQLFPNGSVQKFGFENSLNHVHYRGFDELTEGNAKF